MVKYGESIKFVNPTNHSPLVCFAQMDLVSTVGESVALGAAGIIFRGDSSSASSNVSIHTHDYYMIITQFHMITSVCHV